MYPRIILLIMILYFGSIPGALFSANQSISGFVKDYSNRKTLIGTNIFIKGTHIGTISNNSGYYIINDVPVGKQTLVFSFLGYERKEIEVTIIPNQAKILNITLKPTVLEGKEVMVVAEKISKNELKTSTIKITPRHLKSASQMGEADLMRMLQTLPGVLTLSEFSSGLYIRGGTPDQNLILLDGTEAYNVNHLFGIFSTFDVDAVKHAARIGAELGADIIKTNYTGSPDTFKEVVNGCPVPVVMAGGPKTKTSEEFCQMVYDMVDSKDEIEHISGRNELKALVFTDSIMRYLKDEAKGRVSGELGKHDYFKASVVAFDELRKEITPEKVISHLAG